MRSIEVSIHVVSESLSLDEITRILGVQPSSWSHSIGDQRPGKGIWDAAVWKTEEIKVPNLSFEVVMQGFLAAGVSFRNICGLAKTHGLRINIDAACYTDAGNLSLGIDNSSMLAFSNLGANLDISFYACSEMS